jgi:hypothetical protein
MQEKQAEFSPANPHVDISSSLGIGGCSCPGQEVRLSDSQWAVESSSLEGVASSHPPLAAAPKVLETGFREVVIELPSGQRSERVGTDGAQKGQQHSPAGNIVQYGIPRDNKGFLLLQRAGWHVGEGLGKGEQGLSEPLKPRIHHGNLGLGFQKTNSQGKEAAAQDAAGKHPQRKKIPLPPDPLESEHVETKVKRVRQIMHAEDKAKAGKDISRYIYMAFSDATGEPTADNNPLLRTGKNKLSTTNPLL